MFWNWFGSDRKVLEALEQSTGYDMSPTIVRAPANTDNKPVFNKVPTSAEDGDLKLEIWDDYTFSQEEVDMKVEEFWDKVANSKR